MKEGEENGEEEEAELLPTWKIFFNGINPVNTEEWSDMRFYVKFYEIFKVRILLALRLMHSRGHESSHWKNMRYYEEL